MSQFPSCPAESCTGCLFLKLVLYDPQAMTNKLVNEITYHMKSLSRPIGRISFIGHSLGCILIRLVVDLYIHTELVARSCKPLA